jgi:hypothetical protein
MNEHSNESNTRLDEPGTGPELNGKSRGEFLKWGTLALSGLYVGPKITTFALQGQLGQAGSVPVTTPVPTPPSPTPFTPVFPETGGAANLTPAQRAALKKRDR